MQKLSLNIYLGKSYDNDLIGNAHLSRPGLFFFDKIKARDEKKMKLNLAEYLMVQFCVYPLSVIPEDSIIICIFFPPMRDNGFKRHASNFVGTGRISRKRKA